MAQDPHMFSRASDFDGAGVYPQLVESWYYSIPKMLNPWEPTTFIFRDYNPYIGGLKPSFFMVLGSKRCMVYFPTFGLNLFMVHVGK